MDEDKKKKKLELVERVVELLSHGEAHIVWADHTVVKISKIITDAEIKK